MKRITAVCVCLLVFALLPFSAKAAFDPASIKSASALLMDGRTGSIIFEKNGSRERFPASTTKIMTGILAIENGNLDEKITVGREVRGFSSENSLMGIKEGEIIPLRDLIYGLMLVSGNEAADTIAINIGGSIDGFTAMMNEKAKELGMNGTHFVNSNGLNNDEHYTTARDLAILAKYAYANPAFKEIVGTKTYSVAPTNKHPNGLELANTNRLISADPSKAEYNYTYATGIKTGNTSAAKGCLVASAEKDGKLLLAVILGDPSAELTARWTEAVALFEYGFDALTTATAAELSINKSITVVAGNADENDAQGGQVELIAKLDGIEFSGDSGFITKVLSDQDGITATVNLNPLVAPVAEGEVCGTVDYAYDAQPLFSAELYASRAVSASGEAAPSATPGPDGTPSELSTEPKTTTDEPDSPWLFWILILALIVIGALVARYVLLRKKHQRRGPGPKRKYYVYKK